MSEEQEDVQDQATESAPADKPPAGEVAPETEPAPTGATDVEEGKAFAILSYGLGLAGIPFFLVPLIMRNNEFSLYHAKQCLILALLLVAAGVLATVSIATFILMFLAPLVWFAACIALWVGCVMGIVASSKGETKPLPVIGKWGEDWFKGIQKV